MGMGIPEYRPWNGNGYPQIYTLTWEWISLNIHLDMEMNIPEYTPWNGNEYPWIYTLKWEWIYTLKWDWAGFVYIIVLSLFLFLYLNHDAWHNIHSGLLWSHYIPYMYCILSAYCTLYCCTFHDYPPVPTPCHDYPSPHSLWMVLQIVEINTHDTILSV